jgi:hypothetical protein
VLLEISRIRLAARNFATACIVQGFATFRIIYSDQRYDAHAWVLTRKKPKRFPIQTDTSELELK